MSDSRSWTDENGKTSTNSSEDQEKTDSSDYSSEKKERRNRDLYKISSEQIIVHRWFLSDIQSLNNQEKDFYLQSSSFGCTGENGFLQWIIRFHPTAPPPSRNKPSIDSINHDEPLTKVDNNSALNEVSKDDENAQHALLNTLRNLIINKENPSSSSHTESLNQLLHEILLKQSTTMKEDTDKVHIPILNDHILKTLSQSSVTTTDEESSSDDKAYCAFEVLRINGYEPSPQALFETTYQIFEVSDDGILNLLKTEGRHQVHFHRALITQPRDTIFSISSNNILFSIKLTIYECSSTIGHWQSNNKNLETLSHKEFLLSNISNGDANRFCNNNPMIELSSGHIFWLMSVEKIYTDIIIYSSDNQEFHVHRLILCTSCKKLIDTNHSINGFILRRILKYIYTGEIEICIGEFSIDEIRDLLNAADLLELVQLKNLLTKKCLNHITEKTCLDLLRIADDKQMKILKNRILTFLSQRFSQMFDTDVWQQFCNTRPHLINETFANLLRLNHLQKSIIEQLQGETPRH